MVQFSYYSIPPLISSAIFAFLGGLVYFKNKKAQVNRIFGIFCLATFWWQFSWFILFNFQNNDMVATFMVRVGYTGISFIGVTMLHFIVEMFDYKKIIKYIYFSYGFTFLLFLFLWLTNYYINGFYHYEFGYYPKASFLHPVHLFHQLVLGGIPCYILIWLSMRKYRQVPMKYLQSKYLLIALIVYFPAAVDYLTNYGIAIYPSGYIFILGTASIIALTIIRYRLMEIDTVVHRTALWLLTLVFLVIPMALIVALLKHRIVSLTLISTLSVVSVLLIFFVWYYNRLRPLIDHFFRRRKYDYHQVLSEIGERIGSELDVSKVVARLFKELKEILYIRNSVVFIQQLGEKDYRRVGSMSSDSALEKSAAAEVEFTSPLSRWLQENQKALEREQVEIDPQYTNLKAEALPWFDLHCIEVLIPVIMENNVIGLIGLGKKENLQTYTGKDIELLETMGRHLGITFDNALHHGDIIEKERMDEDLKLGREIQMNLLPREIPRVPNLALHGLMIPANEIGGDYYDFIALPNKEEIAIVIGDVSGKGVGAGLLMSMTKATINAFSQEEISPKQILLRTNAFLYQQIEGQKFMTLLYFKWQPQSRTFRYSSAGHEHVLIFHAAAGEVEAIPSGGFVLGMLPDIESLLEEKEITFHSGDKILLYTDGVTDADNKQEERFGLTRLQEAFQRHSRKPAAELIVAVKDEVYGFIGNQPQYDDITLVAMEVQ